MIRYLTVDEILFIHKIGIEEHGGGDGILNRSAIESAVIQPQTAYFGQEQYPTLQAKAAALGFSLIMNHAFVDGNKRVGFTAMKTFLLLNEHSFKCTPDEGEQAILSVAKGEITIEQFAEWIENHSELQQPSGE